MFNTQDISNRVDPIKAAVAYLIIGVIATAVFSNQPDPIMQIVGRGFHFLNIAICIFIGGKVLGRGFYVYATIVAALFVLDKAAGYRLPYLVALNVLFLAAGLSIGSSWRKLATNILVAVVLVSGALMLLQVLGVGEWTQALTTHGFFVDGTRVPIKPEPTLFVGYYESTAYFLQGRPAGLLYSNQFASLIILSTLSLSMAYRLPLWIEIPLCVVAVLTLAKIVLLGLGLMGVFLFLLGGEHRKTAIRYGIASASALAAYAILFPGLFQIFFFNRQMLMQVSVRPDCPAKMAVFRAMPFDAWRIPTAGVRRSG